METSDAARAICSGVERGASMIRFPWQLAAGMALLRWMPIWLYDLVAGGWVNPGKGRHGSANGNS
jgi:hypothetical protein